MSQRAKKKDVEREVAPVPVTTSPPARRTAMGVIDLVLGALFVIGVWAFLPIRWWPVDVGASMIGAGFVASGVLLLRGHAMAERVAKIVAGVTLAIGIVVIAALAYTIGNLYGLYGPVGQGGAVLLLVALVLLVPYLVVFPAAQVYFLLPRAR
ncbi:hypothetical protein [Sandaracinus amylolyticus]|uniref:hypothetical protein n=1 Tax=Sandaracinus amylolyticus TaxID=927083 RepID=UPI001F26D563|nr:hypothetical protein [Sandaracinus amylolyticus]UJR84084.1 Hypothetical protein I5071_61550 [Sandaracinus amylolyticus]